MLSENESKTEMTTARRSFMRLQEYMNACIIGQTALVDKLLIALDHRQEIQCVKGIGCLSRLHHLANQCRDIYGVAHDDLFGVSLH